MSKKNNTKKPIKVKAVIDSTADAFEIIETLGFVLSIIDEKHFERLGIWDMTTHVYQIGRLIEAIAKGGAKANDKIIAYHVKLEGLRKLGERNE